MVVVYWNKIQMMENMKRLLLVAASLFAGMAAVQAQDSTKVWTLKMCIDHALENNIQLQQSRNDYLSGIEDTKEAKSSLFPSVTGSTSQGFVNYPSSNATTKNSYTGSYGVDASLTLYSGGKLRTNLKQMELQNKIDELAVNESENDIRTSIVTAYMQVLYATEALDVAENTAEVSKAQRDRAEQMWKAGSLSKVDFAQLESQYASDSYSVVAAQVSVDNYKLQLKQLLELGITDEIEVTEPDDEADVLRLLESKETIYNNALGYMPEIQRSRLDITAAELAVRQARSGFYPTASLSAGVGTGHSSGGGNFRDQMWNRFNESIGLNISVPIFSNRKNRTAVNKANISLANSQLSAKNEEKDLLNKVETAYLDAVSAQSQYSAAVEKEKYAEESYNLTSEQFKVGAKNTVELITAQNELFSASQEKLQSKYMALLNMSLLDIYQGKFDNQEN